MNRRTFITALATLATACRPGSRNRPAAAAPTPPPSPQEPPLSRMPAIFVGHGSPMTALDAVKGASLAQWGRGLPRPRAIIAVSAHWESTPLTIGTTETRPLIYDFGGFPRPLYEVEYAAPGAPELAERVAALATAQPRREADRGLDHGVWTPLVHMFPDAGVPVLQLSMPSSLGARGVFALGEALAPLRDEGVLLYGSGNITHNLRAMGPEGSAPQAWAAEFDEWSRERIVARDWDGLHDYARRAPAFERNHPTAEHWLPLFFAVGAASADEARFPVEGFEHQNLSRRSVQLG